MPKPATVIMGRQRQPRATSLRWELDTGGAALRCSLFWPGLDWLTTLGPEAKFRGIVKTHLSSQGISGRICSAELIDVDLAEVCRKCLPHHAMSGLAALTLPDANFHHGRIESASGSLVVNRGGQISRSFFDAMVAHLRMPGQRPPGSSGPLEYLQFGLGFNLNPGGLELKGLCHTDNGNAILTDGDQLLLLEPDKQVPVVNLVKTLAAPSADQVPATPEGGWLLRWLPILPPENDGGSVEVGGKGTQAETRR